MLIKSIAWPRYVAKKPDTEEAQSSTRLSRTKKALASLSLAICLSATSAATASAVIVSAGGGTWNYGIANWLPSMNWSNYYHPSKKHGSSVTGDAGLVRSACVGKRSWAYASAWDKNPFRIDHAYWRYC
ncbi:MAG: lactococcin 972 family bacteriocin [Propionibacteriaceae bacterium]|nr:lactococcin 972 family bacteriocin [Propionibacteriaceae bacterium]